MRHVTKPAAVVLALAVFEVSALGAVRAGAPPSETLIMSAPKGFKVGDPAALAGQDGAKIAEYIPQAETLSNWSQMVTAQVVRDLKKSDPDTFAESLKGPWLKACDDSEVHEIKNGEENGYTYSTWVFSCPLNVGTGKPKNTFVKFISGNDGLYSIQYIYQSALSPDMATAAMDYLGDVRACDTRLADRPCPPAAP